MNVDKEDHEVISVHQRSSAFIGGSNRPFLQLLTVAARLRAFPSRDR
jgi:hypothetical protein